MIIKVKSKYSIKITMPEKIKNQFVNWSQQLKVNPDDTMYHGDLPKDNGVTNKLIGDYIYSIWKDVSALQKIANKNDALLYIEINNLPIERKAASLLTMGFAYIMNAHVRIDKIPPFNQPFFVIQIQKGYENTVSSYRSMQRFPLHNDRMFTEGKPVDFLLLYGLSPGITTPNTYFVPLIEVIKNMPENLYNALFNCEAFQSPKTGKKSSGLQGNPTDRFNVTTTLDIAEGLMIPLTPEAIQALKWLQKYEHNLLIDEYAFQINPGKAIIADHRKTLHARDALTTMDYERSLLRSHFCRAK